MKHFVLICNLAINKTNYLQFFYFLLKNTKLRYVKEVRHSRNYTENTSIKSVPRFERRLIIVHVTFNKKNVRIRVF